jgi:hypothetical protein
MLYSISVIIIKKTLLLVLIAQVLNQDGKPYLLFPCFYTHSRPVVLRKIALLLSI